MSSAPKEDAAKPGNFLRAVIERDLEAGTYVPRRFAGSPGDAAHQAAGAPDPAEPRLGHLPGMAWEPGSILRIEGNIGRHPGDRKRMAVLTGAYAAHYLAAGLVTD